jgi:calcineurin-like phosphoesterase
LGVKPEQSITMFLGNPRGRYEEAPGACKIECAVFTIDMQTKRCINVEGLRIYD